MKEGKNHNMAKVVTFLDRHKIDYLDKLGKDYFFKYGRKLSRGKILSELVLILANIGVKIEDIDFENESLCEGILKAIKNGGKNSDSHHFSKEKW